MNNYIEHLIFIILILSLIITIYFNIRHYENFEAAFSNSTTSADPKKVQTYVPEKKANVKYPDSDDIVNYSEYTCYKNEAIAGGNKSEPTGDRGICTNESIRDRYLFKPKPIKDNSDIREFYEDNLEALLNPVTQRRLPNNLHTSAQNLRSLPVWMEDPKLEGYNIYDADNHAGIKDIGKIPVTSTDKFPRATGYIFTLND
jgi:hypothetical protein